MAKLPPRPNSPPSRRAESSAGWFYEIESESFGPVDFRELRSLAMSRQLLGHHLVWKSGTNEKQEAGSILGLIPTQKKAPEPIPPSEISDKNPYAAPKTRTIWEGPPGGMYLPHLHPANLLLFFLILVVPIGLIFLCQKIVSANTRDFLISLAGIGLAAWVILAIIYLHRAWQMMQMFGAHLTGSKAIRFLFLPIFNSLWCFVVVFGWAKLWNQNVRNHPGLQPASAVWSPLFFLFPIMLFISQGFLVMHFLTQEWPVDLRNQKHLLSLTVWGATLGLTLICWCQIGLSINFLARKKM